MHNIPSFHQLHQMCDIPSFAEQECTLQAMRASTNIQPRKNLPPMVPEFKQVTHQNSQTPLPAHAWLLSTRKRGYVASAKENNENQVTVGVHFAPEEFLSEAIRLCHPMEHNCLFPKEVSAHVTHLSDRSVHWSALRKSKDGLPCQRNYPPRSEILRPQLAPE